MIFGGRAPRIGAYVSARGVVAVECATTSDGIEVRRAFGEPIGLRTTADAANRLVEVLRAAGIARARVSVTLRGFGVAYQNLQLPPAPDAVLDAVVEREVRRLEPHLSDCVVQWISLPSIEATVPGAPPQRAIFATAAPTEVVAALDERLAAEGHRLEHVTTLPVALQRVLEQFDSGTGTVALVTALPDAAFIAFSLDGGVRLIVEPPLPQDAEHEAAALAEELELAVTFVRQQFRGAPVDRVVLVGARRSLAELRSTITERMGVPVKAIEDETLAPAALAALGAVIDAGSSQPQSLGGATRAVAARRSVLSQVETLSLAALIALGAAGLWTVAETVRTYRAGAALATALRRVESDDFGLAALRTTAEQRRLVSRALDAVRLANADRAQLQSTLASLAAALPPPVAIDTLRLGWQDGAWLAIIGGAIESSSSARAVQVLHDVYQDLPGRLAVDSLHLDRLAYDEDASGGGAESGTVRFQLSFAMRAAGTPR